MVSKKNLPKRNAQGPETFSGCTANTNIKIKQNILIPIHFEERIKRITIKKSKTE